ncbi:MAG: PA2779 family protein [bacterium]
MIRLLTASRFRYLVGQALLFSFLLAVLITPAARARTEFPSPDSTKSSVSKENYDRKQDMAIIQKSLAKKKVREKLEKLGYTPAEVTKRLERLSDERIHKMANDLRSVRKGSHLGLNEVEAAVLIVAIIFAPILVPVAIVLWIFGHELHLHHG